MRSTGKSVNSTQRSTKKLLDRNDLIKLASTLKSGVGVGLACKQAGIYEREFYLKYRKDPIIEQAMASRKFEKSETNRKFYGDPQPKKVRRKKAEIACTPDSEILPLGLVK